IKGDIAVKEIVADAGDIKNIQATSVTLRVNNQVVTTGGDIRADILARGGDVWNVEASGGEVRGVIVSYPEPGANPKNEGGSVHYVEATKPTVVVRADNYIGIVRILGNAGDVDKSRLQAQGGAAFDGGTGQFKGGQALIVDVGAATLSGEVKFTYG